jgi:maltose alpha-D-glucosyltransferase/alpha-amylase
MPVTRNESDLQWYKDAIIYELHVKSFFDGYNDGIGDFRGLITKLPYLADLGVTALWLLPFYPSPLRDDGYDIADYLDIHPAYGTLADFREFMKEAHQRGIRVITELVLNHTSDQHAWFQRARRAQPGSWQRDFYVWSDTPDRYLDARVIFKDFMSSNWAWDPVAKSYYWHRFYSHQPDLNFDNPMVHEALFHVVDFWLGMGVDGLRLDAVPYLYEREGSNCENLPETFSFLKKLRAYINRKYPGRILLAEANQWPEDAVKYFGVGDLCQMAFHFPLMPRMFMAVQMEDRFPIEDILEQTPPIPDTCQWAIFVRNHDELTLEMVTDEERDYMYNVYARDSQARINLGIRRRLAPLMGNNRRKIELIYLLLFTLPGTPIVYYGDEIGMGDNYYLGDRDGVRTPMQWSPDRNAGFSRCNPQKLFLPAIIDPEYHYEAVNVENQGANTSSLLWWMRWMIAVRKRHKAFGRGSFELRPLANPKVLAFIRSYEMETILVLVNLSRFDQMVEISHPRFAGQVPVDLFSRNRFPAIKDSPYVIVLGPYGSHLLLLQESGEPVAREREATPPAGVGLLWEDLVKGKEPGRLGQLLQDYLADCDWFGGRARTITSIRVETVLPVSGGETTFLLAIIDTSQVDGTPEKILLPLHCAVHEEARRMREESPRAIIASLDTVRGEGLLCDGIHCERVREILIDMITRNRTVRINDGVLAGSAGRAMRVLLKGVREASETVLLYGDRNAVSVRFDDSFFFKLYRRIEEGLNPETEIGSFLTDRIDFSGVPPYAGSIEYRRIGKEPVTLAILQGYMPSHSDAWTVTSDEAGRFLERVMEMRGRIAASPPAPQPLLGVCHGKISSELGELLGGVFQGLVEMIGRRTAEFHLALSSRSDETEFAPEQFNKQYQRSVYQSMRAAARKVFFRIGNALPGLEPAAGEMVRELLKQERELMKCLQFINEKVYSAKKIRIHGDYQLAKLLYTGKDFVITGFGGESDRILSERRIKRSPLRDVAGMIRSIHSAVYSQLDPNHGRIRNEDADYLEPWAVFWYRHAAGSFLNSYLATMKEGDFFPAERKELKRLLDIFIIDRAVYELGSALDDHPGRITLPIRGIFDVLSGV